jgi:broad specificity phosphatase PhoE
MTRLWLVRHAEPAAAWSDHDDPGLSAHGARQADELATRLSDPSVRCPAAVVSSPLSRARETAAPLGARLGQPVRVEPRVGEVPTPQGATATRTAWLRDVLARRWPDLDGGMRAWREQLLDALVEAGDAVVATHFVAINVAVGAACGDDRVQCCSPAHTSVTALAVDGPRLSIVRLGAEVPAATAR